MDEYFKNRIFELNESISDSSSDEEESQSLVSLSESSSGSISPSITSSSSSSSSSTSSSNKSSSSSSSSETPKKKIIIIDDEDEEDIICEPIINFKAIEPDLETIEISSLKEDEPDIEKVFQSTDDLVPLRKRTGSDLQSLKEFAVPLEQSLRNSSSVKEIDKETPEKWRSRIWPTKGITSYCRIITKCKPPSYETLMDPKSKLIIRPHWRETEMQPVGTVFSNIMLHSSIFFLLTIEESRSSLGVDISRLEDPFEMESTVTNVAKPKTWFECEINKVVSESDFGSLPQACDPRLGSVWVVNVLIRTPNVFLNETTGLGKKIDSVGTTTIIRDQSLSGGDLLYLKSDSWSHPLLGIIQPWDPDYDIKFGSTLYNNKSFLDPEIAHENKDLTMANLLICVDNGETPNIEELGGWAQQGDIIPGLNFQMRILGNVMTHIRECQALLSLRLVNSNLRNLILNPEAASIDLSFPIVPSNINNLSTIQTNNSNLSIPCPINVPIKLWKKLNEEYNDSQLKAIYNSCRRDPISKIPYPICLLQGSVPSSNNLFSNTLIILLLFFI